MSTRSRLLCRSRDSHLLWNCLLPTSKSLCLGRAHCHTLKYRRIFIIVVVYQITVGKHFEGASGWIPGPKYIHLGFTGLNSSLDLTSGVHSYKYFSVRPPLNQQLSAFHLGYSNVFGCHLKVVFPLLLFGVQCVVLHLTESLCLSRRHRNTHIHQEVTGWPFISDAWLILWG